MPDVPRIVIIEDDRQVRELLRVVLTDAGMQPVGASEGPTGLEYIRAEHTDLILLDHNLDEGGLTGLDVCATIREDAATAQIPVIVLTSEASPEVELAFLEAGADDYIRKGQFKSAVLIGRIHAVLRRTGQAGSDAIETEHLVMHPGRREVLVDGEQINLTPTEFDILYKLASNRDRTLTRRELLDRGDKDGEGVDRTVDVHVLSIRRKLGSRSWLVATVWGRGYCLGTPAAR